MTNGTEPCDDAPRSASDAPSSLVDALLVYAEPLASDAYAIVLGDSKGAAPERLLELGARGVLVFDPDPGRAASAARPAARGITVRALGGALDVRDGAFDVAVIPDLAEVNDVRTNLARLRRALSTRGTVVAMGRARLSGAPADDAAFAGELGPATLSYDELYDGFAAEFEAVTLAGVIPFKGVVFAELGVEDEAPAVSVDTRLAAPPPPSAFVVVASGAAHMARGPLDPYAIVQVPEDDQGPRETTGALEAAVAAASQRSELLSTQLDEARERAVVADVRSVEAAGRLERGAAERDAALTRVMELEAVLAASQQLIASIEARLFEAEQGLRERDDRIAALSGERAEAALALHVADLAHVEAHAAETAAYEEQLQDRARVIAELTNEVHRREQLVKELVASLEESREGAAAQIAFEAPSPCPDPAAIEEAARLRLKVDELAAEIARREGELTARGWRIAELESELGRAERAIDAATRPALDELDALRQALAQEHAARVAAESGEALARARGELARQAVLLEQMRGRAESA